jgi:glycosyltransferase involved in cell wall biosynthesis
MADKIKIFVDAHWFDQEFQGSRTFIRGIYHHMMKKENIILYMAAYDIENLRQNFSGSDNIVFLKYASRSKYFRLAYDIPSIIKKYKIDFAHFQYVSPLFKNCRQIVTIHDLLFRSYPSEFPFFYRASKNFLFSRSAKKADILTTVSQHSKDAISRYFNLPGNQVHLIPNGVNEKYFEKVDKCSAKEMIRNKYGIDKMILFVSRIEPRKNHLILVKAFQELALYKKGYHLILLGHESIKVNGLKKQIENDPEGKDFIHFFTSITEDELLLFYSAAECFVYPSKAEGFGLPPLEAAASGIPVICSNSCGMKEYSFFGNGHIEPGDLDLLKNRISDVLDGKYNKVLLEEISKKIRNDYSWNASSEKFYQLIVETHSKHAVN